MGRVSLKDLRRSGITDDDLQAARALQEAQRRAGAPVLPLSVIVGRVAPLAALRAVLGHRSRI